jgi:hypothetical protein
MLVGVMAYLSLARLEEVIRVSQQKLKPPRSVQGNHAQSLIGTTRRKLCPMALSKKSKKVTLKL